MSSQGSLNNITKKIQLHLDFQVKYAKLPMIGERVKLYPSPENLQKSLDVTQECICIEFNADEQSQAVGKYRPREWLMWKS